MDTEQKTDLPKIKLPVRVTLYVAVIALSLYILLFLYIAVREVYFPNKNPYDEQAARLEEQELNQQAAKTTGIINNQKVKTVKIAIPIKEKPIHPYETNNSSTGPNFTRDNIIIVHPSITDWLAKQDEFRRNTGFVGEIRRYEKPKPGMMSYSYVPLGGRQNFQFMNGSFPLTAPTDTVSFMNNCDFIIENIMLMYEQTGEDFFMEHNHPKVRRAFGGGVSFRDYNISYYQVFDESKLQLGTDFSGIRISYRDDIKQYNITNNLFEHPLKIPKQIISSKMAIEIASKELVRKKIKTAEEVRNMPRHTRRIMQAKYGNAPYYFYLQVKWAVFFGKEGGPYFDINATTGKILKYWGWVDYNWWDPPKDRIKKG